MGTESCKVCLLEHDEEIHAATLRLREWFREKVKRNLDDQQEGEAPASAA
jgi:hypothetical protein